MLPFNTILKVAKLQPDYILLVLVVFLNRLPQFPERLPIAVKPPVYIVQIFCSQPYTLKNAAVLEYVLYY